MFKHNLVLIFRNLKKYKTTFLINLIGLSSGLACVLLIYLWVNDELRVDKFHEKADQLYQVMENTENSEGTNTSEATPGPLAEALVKEMPEVSYAVNIPDGLLENSTLSADDKNIKAAGQYVGKDFFNVFSYEILEGNKNKVISDKNSVAISASLAEKLFGSSTDVVGKTIRFQHQKDFIISGIFKDVPSNSSLQFDYLLPYEYFLESNQWALRWGNHNPRTVLVLKKGTDIGKFNRKIEDFVKSKYAESDVKLFVRPYSNAYLFNKYENGKLAGGRIEYINLFSLVAVFILIIAAINFMNLSTAQASRRMKEVGVKKAIGAGRGSLIAQYMGESLLLTFLSLICAVVLVITLLPEFNLITGKNLFLAFEPDFIFAISAISLITGILSGSYPALYLSGFNPIVVLKGKLKSSLGEILIRKGLVIIQFSLSVIFILAVLVIYKQIEFIQNKNLGYSKDNVIYFKNEGEISKKLKTFTEEVRGVPGVTNASSIRHLMNGHMNSTSGIEWTGKTPADHIDFEHIGVRYGMIETLGIQFVEGRSFSENNVADTTRIIFNEAAIRAMNIKEPLGKTVIINGDRFEIIGVTKDFHFSSLHEEVKPAFFRITPREPWYIMAKLEAGKEKQALSGLESLYKEFNPGFAFDFKFLDEKFQEQYVAEQRVASLSKYFAGLAILISCLGLFGLAAFSAERRVKEIGIRKVLGSNTRQIIYLLSADFAKLVFIAIVIALPLGYLATAKWLENFAFSIDLKWWYFVGAGGVALVIALLTVSSQAIKAARVNPVKSLKNE